MRRTKNSRRKRTGRRTQIITFSDADRSAFDEMFESKTDAMKRTFSFMCLATGSTRPIAEYINQAYVYLFDRARTRTNPFENGVGMDTNIDLEFLFHNANSGLKDQYPRSWAGRVDSLERMNLDCMDTRNQNEAAVRSYATVRGRLMAAGLDPTPLELQTIGGLSNGEAATHMELSVSAFNKRLTRFKAAAARLIALGLLSVLIALPSGETREEAATVKPAISPRAPLFVTTDPRPKDSSDAPETVASDSTEIEPTDLAVRQDAATKIEFAVRQDCIPTSDLFLAVRQDARVPSPWMSVQFG